MRRPQVVPPGDAPVETYEVGRRPPPGLWYVRSDMLLTAPRPQAGGTSGAVETGTPTSAGSCPIPPPDLIRQNPTNPGPPSRGGPGSSSATSSPGDDPHHDEDHREKASEREQTGSALAPELRTPGGSRPDEPGGRESAADPAPAGGRGRRPPRPRGRRLAANHRRPRPDAGDGRRRRPGPALRRPVGSRGGQLRGARAYGPHRRVAQ